MATIFWEQVILSPSAHHFDLMFKCYEDWAAILPLKGKSDCRGRILQKMKQGHFPFGTPNYRLWHVISKELYYFIASMDVDLVWYSFEILCVGLLSSFMFQILQILSRFSSRNSNSRPFFFPQRLETRQYLFENPTLLEVNCTSDLTWIGPWHSLSSRLPKFVKHFYFSLCL